MYANSIKSYCHISLASAMRSADRERLQRLLADADRLLELLRLGLDPLDDRDVRVLATGADFIDLAAELHEAWAVRERRKFVAVKMAVGVYEEEECDH